MNVIKKSPVFIELIVQSMRVEIFTFPFTSSLGLGKLLNLIHEMGKIISSLYIGYVIMMMTNH